MGVPLTYNSPGVGQNLQSQVGTGDVIFTLESPVSFNAFRILLNPANLINYLVNKEGPLSGVSGFDGLGNIQVNERLNASSNTHNHYSKDSIHEPNWPDLQIILLALHAGKP